jgi:hypothetical protein
MNGWLTSDSFFCEAVNFPGNRQARGEVDCASTDEYTWRFLDFTSMIVAQLYLRTHVPR